MRSSAIKMRANAIAISIYRVVQTIGNTIDGGVRLGFIHSYQAEFTDLFVKYCPPKDAARTDAMAIIIARTVCIEYSRSLILSFGKNGCLQAMFSWQRHSPFHFGTRYGRREQFGIGDR